MRTGAIAIIVLFAIFLFSGLARNEKISLPCEEPLAYNIGIFDRRFGITQKDFLSALAEAETIWEESAGKELFIYSPETGDLSINLIYDYRQEITKTLENLGKVVEEDESTYEEMQSKYVLLKAEYDNLENLYDAQVKVLNEQNDAYQAKVEIWNNGKRNSKAQFDELENERIDLQAKVAELKALEKQLNEKVAEVNSLAERLNRLANSLNLNAEKFNTVGASRGETFTGGMFLSADEGRSIDIYEFSNREKLVRILAHELGHALGLEHLDDSQAIMYYLNEGETSVLTQTDLAALRALCGGM